MINNNNLDHTFIGKRSLASLDQGSLFCSGTSPLLLGGEFDAFALKESH
jgi:hypothetical protein